jgi:hypothetical protein
VTPAAVREPAVDPIQIDPEGPADTVRAFYRDLKEKRFREAIFLTNLRPAIEGLTDTDLKDFALDFEALAGQVPAKFEINGEIVSGDRATVTAKLPNADGDKTELQAIQLRREKDVWVILTADEEAESRIRKEGKRYFFNLRMATHESEAKRMLDRVAKGEMAYSLQNGGLYADMPTLIAAGFLPDDIRTSESTGYNYLLTVSADKKTYTASATPAEYGHSGRLSLLLSLDKKGIPRMSSEDIGGKQLSR